MDADAHWRRLAEAQVFPVDLLGTFQQVQGSIGAIDHAVENEIEAVAPGIAESGRTARRTEGCGDVIEESQEEARRVRFTELAEVLDIGKQHGLDLPLHAVTGRRCSGLLWLGRRWPVLTEELLAQVREITALGASLRLRRYGRP